MQRLNKLFITALFGAIIFVANAFLPPPLNYMMIVVQAVLLALSGLFIKGGATYVGAVGGFLTALVEPSVGTLHFPIHFFVRYVCGCIPVSLQNHRPVKE